MTVRFLVISVDSLITLLFVFAELELEQNDDVGDEDAGDGEATGVAQLEGRHRRNGTILQNLSPQYFDLKRTLFQMLFQTMFQDFNLKIKMFQHTVPKYLKSYIFRHNVLKSLKFKS